MNQNEENQMIKVLDKIVEHVIIQINQIKLRLDLIQTPSQDYPMNAKQAAEYIHVSQPTILKYIHRGTIPAHRIGTHWRILKTQLDTILKEGMNPNK